MTKRVAENVKGGMLCSAILPVGKRPAQITVTQPMSTKARFSLDVDIDVERKESGEQQWGCSSGDMDALDYHVGRRLPIAW